MVGGMVCPDCGGVVGATETTEDGDPCRCFAGQAKPSSDTVVIHPPSDAPTAKVCRICGKDVSGRKRVKSHAGYACYDCDKEEEKRLNYGRVRCGVCGHLVKEENLLLWEAVRICPACHAEKTEAKKAQLARMGFKGGAKSLRDEADHRPAHAAGGAGRGHLYVGMRMHGHH